MLVTLTLPLTHVKDEDKSVVAVTTPLILVKNEVKYDPLHFYNTFEWCWKVKANMRWITSTNTYVETDIKKGN